MAYIAYLRLSESLQPLATKMSASFQQLGSQLTELKLDHKDGKVASARLTALLDRII